MSLEYARNISDLLYAERRKESSKTVNLSDGDIARSQGPTPSAHLADHFMIGDLDCDTFKGKI
jgi:hypothetical protein